MRIGINALYLIPGGVGGTETYLRCLVAALERVARDHEIVVFTNRETGPLGARCEVLPVRARLRPWRILYEQSALPLALRRHGIDVLLNPGFTAPLLGRLPQVTVFHDLQHKRHPEFFRWFDLPFWRLLLWGSAMRSTRLIAVSEPVRRDLLHYYGRDAAVVPHGVEEAFFELSARRQPADFLLYPSTTHPHKNHERLLRVFSRLRQDEPALRLVLTGVPGFADGKVKKTIEELGLRDAVECRGWVPRGNSWSFTAEPAASSIRRCLKASACPCLKRWLPASRWRAAASSRCGGWPTAALCSSIPTAAKTCCGSSPVFCAARRPRAARRGRGSSPGRAPPGRRLLFSNGPIAENLPAEGARPSSSRGISRSPACTATGPIPCPGRG